MHNIAAKHLAGLSKDRKFGSWGLSSTPNGFITGNTFLLILEDLIRHVDEHYITRPIILFMDSAGPHISLAMADFCKAHQIQPWLFKSNCTNITQPLELTVMNSLKDVFKRKVNEWQQTNMTSLSKYTVVPLLRALVEELLVSRPGVIVSSFWYAGQVPWNPLAVEQTKLIPSSIFAPTKDQVLESGSSDRNAEDPESEQEAGSSREGLEVQVMQDCVVSGEEERVMKLQGKDMKKVELPKFCKDS